MKVLYLPEVEQYLFELIETLYREDYFSFAEDAVEYVWKIRQAIENAPLNIIERRKAPEHFSQYGKDMNYIVYKANTRTQWYIFFQRQEDICLVRHITNNYIAAQYFNN